MSYKQLFSTKFYTGLSKLYLKIIGSIHWDFFVKKIMI
jgi:hypothetical protein